MMTHILLNLPEEYGTIVEIIEDKLDEKDHPITTERIHNKILVKFDGMNKQSETKPSGEDEKYLDVKSQYNGTCKTCRKYVHKGNTAVIKKV